MVMEQLTGVNGRQHQHCMVLICDSLRLSCARLPRTARTYVLYRALSYRISSQFSYCCRLRCVCCQCVPYTVTDLSSIYDREEKRESN